MAGLIDLTGQKFNRLTAIELVGSRKGAGNIWRFRCECGKEIEAIGSKVKNGYTKSCGCLQREKASSSNFIDLSGKRFGKLIVLYRVDNIGRCTAWHCKCDCGNEVNVRSESLKSGNTKGCGCESRKGLEKRTTHGKSHDRLYRIWQGMRNRCNLRTNKYYCNYGGRGISVCAEWNESFENFYEWAIKTGYKTDLTLDRKNNDGDYEPSNCRWVSRTVQMNNMRKNNILEYNQEKHTMAEWCRILGFKYHVINSRINNYGWSVEEALSTPTMKRGGVR